VKLDDCGTTWAPRRAALAHQRKEQDRPRRSKPVQEQQQLLRQNLHRKTGLAAIAAPVKHGGRMMKALIAALALATVIAAPIFAQPANAAPVSPASSSFGSNGY